MDTAACDPRLLKLHPGDNILIAARTLPAGETLVVGGAEVFLKEPLPLGFKVAARAIARGEKIIKYTMPVGSATCDIGAGQVVHLHNMKSDYIPTWTREQGSGHDH